MPLDPPSSRFFLITFLLTSLSLHRNVLCDEIYVIQVSSLLNEPLATEERDLQASKEFYKRRRQDLTEFAKKHGLT